MNEFDLIVVGGGPGGSAAATFVSKAGHSVLLLEKESFPRHQIGESLLPATVQGICKLLGVKEEVDSASFAPKRGGTFLWGKSKIPWTFLFEKSARPTAYQVERHKFDAILLNNAEKCGVAVKHNCQVLDVIKENDRVTGVKYKDANGTIVTAKSTYVVDASGHKSMIYQHVGERVQSEFFRNIAIYGYFAGGKRLPEPNQGNILCAAFKYGWIWYIPLTPELTSVGVVVDSDIFLNSNQTQEEFFNNTLSLCPMVTDYLANAQRASSEQYKKLRVRKDFSYTTTKLWTPGMALVGDAACFVDPLFSSGVHLATLSALFIARSINTCLKGSVNEEACFQEFEVRYRREYGNFYNFLLAFYDFEQDEEDYYWNARKIVHTQETGNHAFIKLVSGYSDTDWIPSSDTAEQFFSNRIGVGDSFQHFFTDTPPQESSRSTIDVQKFMKGFTKEIVNIQAQAHGFNPEMNLKASRGLIASSDALHWCEG